ncbi:MAG: BLUF domain-containing protein [Pseudomonadota bacterium]
MLQLAYISEAADDFHIADLPALMQTARKNNRNTGLTGMLLHERKMFMQILEGDAAAIDALLEELHADPRHKNIEIVYRNDELREREFGRWTMACKILGEKFREDFFELDERVKRVLRNVTQVSGDQARQLLLEFRDIERTYIDI